MKRVLVLLGVLLLLGSGPAGAVGFQWATAPDAGNAPLQVAIWYPSGGATADVTVGPFDMDVAMNGAVSAGRYPMIVMSHGTGGMALNSYDTAMALAEAGFVVVAVTHTGDNYLDQSVAFTRQQFVDRPRHISRVIDFMLRAWPGHESIDADRIGMFGHSAGGTTALLIAGGVADLDQLVAFCRATPDDWGCQHARQRGSVIAPAAAPPISALDARVKAVAVAAPAITSAFQPKGLQAITLPIQLWVGARDDIVRDAASIRTILPTPPDYHLVPDGGHFAYLTPCNDILIKAAPVICSDPEGFDRAVFLAGFHQSLIAFYRESLK